MFRRSCLYSFLSLVSVVLATTGAQASGARNCDVDATIVDRGDSVFEQRSIYQLPVTINVTSSVATPGMRSDIDCTQYEGKDLKITVSEAIEGTKPLGEYRIFSLKRGDQVKLHYDYSDGLTPVGVIKSEFWWLK